MNTQASRKSQRERDLVRECFDHMGIQYSLQSIRSVPIKNGRTKGPDVKVTCTMGEQRVRIGVELTEYQNDVVDGSSKGRRFGSFFRKIWGSLSPLLSHDRQLREYHGHLVFDWTQGPRPRDAQAIAGQLVALMRLHVKELADGTRHRFFRTAFRRVGKTLTRCGDLDQFPLLKQYFESITLIRHDNLTGPLLWRYNGACGVGVVVDCIVRKIEDKAKKLCRYDTIGLKEMWLVICAGVGIPHDSAGSALHGHQRLSSQRIRDAASKSGFGRVIFWERTQEWHMYLYKVVPAPSSSSGDIIRNY